MIKTFLTFIIFLTFVNSAFAHTGLGSSSPQNGEIINEELEQITLTFETKVEQGSTFDLQNSVGETISIENITLSENQMVGNLSNPLDNGEYRVNWKIIGADGHPIEGELSFTVEMAITEEESAEEQIKSQEETQLQSKVEEKEVGPVNEAKDAEVQQSKTPSYVIPTIIGILIVIVIGSFLFITKRKK